MQNSQLQPEIIPDYKIYPSLLDSYKWYQTSESENAEQELINKINRRPYQSDAADKGKFFNELIDISIKGIQKHKVCFLNGCALQLATLLSKSVSQVHTSTLIEVDNKVVELYGYVDYVLQDRVIDLKTTRSYELGKYKDSLQLHLYPVSLIDDGNEINEFEFLVCDFENVYSEVYPVDYEISKALITDVCKELIRFLEIKRDFITDKKIFNQQPEFQLC